MPVSAAHFAAWLPGYVRLIGSERAAEIFRRTPGRRERRKRQDAPSHAPLLLTLGFIAAGLLLARALGWLASAAMRGRPETTRFWVRQGAQLLTALLLVVGLTSIWFDDPVRLATALGLISAGLAFALQKVGTAIAGYFVILRGHTFNVGDRITHGRRSGATSSVRPSCSRRRRTTRFPLACSASRLYSRCSAATS